MKLGAHISTAKPFSSSITRAMEIGCECMQIFANPPQRWNPTPIQEEEIRLYKQLNIKAGIDPVIIHSIYLVNFASVNPFFYESSIKSLIDDMRKAKSIGALGVNTHLGSTKGGEFKDCLPKISQSVTRILNETEESNFIIENAAGAGNIIGDTLEEIAEIVSKVNSKRVKVLIDTAHAFASGYDLGTGSGLDDFLDRFDQLLGLDLLAGFHLNDSKSGLNSKRDRHADIGEGEIGLNLFQKVVTHPKLTDKFGILETPQDKMSWLNQLELLKELRKIPNKGK